MSEKQLTCKDYWGDTIKVGRLVESVSDPLIRGKVVAINKVNNKNLIVIANLDGYKENIDPKDCYIYLATREKVRQHAKKWVEKDMKNKKHTYIQYKALGEVQIAEGMVLIPAFESINIYYYVEKDEKTKKYYLQCFFDARSMDISVLEITESIEKVSECFEVAVYANGIPLFKEDFEFDTLEDLIRCYKG
ncbi:MAG: hypothetical protein HFJ41_02015 [Clostridia bacterium]|nr:hypothetical protein [Clostridia bacterium]